jgi:hypothetical protein
MIFFELWSLGFYLTLEIWILDFKTFFNAQTKKQYNR